jgi:hypothetical protein
LHVKDVRKKQRQVFLDAKLYFKKTNKNYLKICVRINWIQCQENVEFIWSQHWLEFALYVVLFVLLFISDWSKENVRNHVKPRNSYVPCEEHFYSNFFTQIDVLVQDLVQNRFKIWLSIKIFYTSFQHISFLIQTYSLDHVFNTNAFNLYKCSHNTGDPPSITLKAV